MIGAAVIVGAGVYVWYRETFVRTATRKPVPRAD